MITQYIERTDSLVDKEIKWHVLLVRPYSERKVGQRLRDMGFEACVPTQKQVRRWSDRKKSVEVVLFSNYVFVATQAKRRNEVFQAGHVIKYVGFGGRIATLTDREAAMIKKLGQLETPVEISYEDFHVGDEVEVLTGPLKSYRGIVTAVNGRARLQLAFPSLQCFARVEVKGEEVKRLVH